MKNKSLGYDKENLIYFPLPESVAVKYDAFKAELLNNPNIQSVSSSATIPTYGITFSNAKWKWSEMETYGDILFRTTFVDYDFFDTYKIKFISGRAFSKDFPSDSTAIIINETAQKMMGFEDPVGQIVKYPGGDQDYQLNVIGVVEDYNFRSLHSEVEPLILLLTYRNSDYVTARISSDNIDNSINHMQTVWDKFAGDKPFNYSFIDETLAALYENEERIEDILKSFSILAVVISSLGLFGLSSFMTMRRTKEIGVRKVLGASIKSVILLLTKEFLKWVIIANLITWPLAYLAMNAWLNQFPYRTNISLWFFASAGFTTLFIAIVTVSYQAIKSAMANPVESLRYE
jgi:putative ABC transport system permease protein